MGDLNKPGWNYRIIQVGNEEGAPWFEMAEVYYNDDGSIKTWCFTSPGGADVDELRDDLIAMFHDFIKHPVVLTEEELNVNQPEQGEQETGEDAKLEPACGA